MNGNRFAEDQMVLCGGRPYTVAAVARDKLGRFLYSLQDGHGNISSGFDEDRLAAPMVSGEEIEGSFRRTGWLALVSLKTINIDGISIKRYILGRNTKDGSPGWGVYALREGHTCVVHDGADTLFNDEEAAWEAVRNLAERKGLEVKPLNVEVRKVEYSASMRWV